MQEENLKISCNLEGESARDYEMMALLFKIQNIAPNRSKQQSLLISAALLALNALADRYSDNTGNRYGALEEVLKFGGCRAQDIEKLLKTSPAAIDAIQGAIGTNSAVK